MGTINTTACAGLPAQPEAPLSCLSGDARESVQISRVTDGDTVVLSDGRRVRIIGLNTLELSAKDPVSQHWAQTASQFLKQSIADGQASLIPGLDEFDRYGRTLAHVQLANGQYAAQSLVRNGLAAAVAIGKNTRCAEQLHHAELQARAANRGIWSNPSKWYIDTTHLSGKERGFHVLTSRITDVQKRSGKTTWKLENGLRVNLKSRALTQIANLKANELLGKRVELRGWLSAHAGGVSLKLHHPANVHLLPN